jgi:hypothetical protein
MDESGAFEVLEQRRRATELSAVTAIAGAIIAVILLIVDAKDPFFSGKGADMAPILILSGTFVVVVGLCLTIPRMVSGKS